MASPEPEFIHGQGGFFGSDESPDQVDDPDTIAGIRRRSSVYTVAGIDVQVASEGVYVVDPETGNLHLVRVEQWVRDRLRLVDMRPDSLLAQWSTARGRRALREALHEELGIGVDDLARRLNKPDCDPIDLLIHLGWDQPLKTRRQRADRFTQEERVFLDRFEAEARQVLASIVDKYSANGPEDLDAKVLTLPPFPDMGSPTQIAARFGGAEQMREAIDELGRRLFGQGAQIL